MVYNKKQYALIQLIKTDNRTKQLINSSMKSPAPQKYTQYSKILAMSCTQYVVWMLVRTKALYITSIVKNIICRTSQYIKEKNNKKGIYVIVNDKFLQYISLEVDTFSSIIKLKSYRLVENYKYFNESNLDLLCTFLSEKHLHNFKYI